MRVMTMDGGFRGLSGGGLGALSQAQQSAAREWFLDRIALFDPTWDRLLAVRHAGQLPAADTGLWDRGNALVDRFGPHLNALNVLVSEQSLASWRTVSEVIVRDVAQWVTDVRRVIGDERQQRGLRLALLAAGSIALLGGAAYVVWKSSR